MLFKEIHYHIMIRSIVKLMRFTFARLRWNATGDSRHLLKAESWIDVPPSIRERWLKSAYRYARHRVGRWYELLFWSLFIITMATAPFSLHTSGATLPWSVVSLCLAMTVLIRDIMQKSAIMLPMLEALTQGWIIHQRDVICLKCGYDLQGNAAAACPECGTTVPTTTGLES